MQSSVAQTSADETTPAKNASSLTSHAENNGEQSCKRIKLDESAAVETVVGQEVANEAPQQEKAIGQQVGGQEEATPPVVRVSKKKYALLIGYSGEGYFGLQRNPSIKNGQFRTIEDEIVDALVKIDAIPQNHADEMFKVSAPHASLGHVSRLFLDDAHFLLSFIDVISTSCAHRQGRIGRGQSHVAQDGDARRHAEQAELDATQADTRLWLQQDNAELRRQEQLRRTHVHLHSAHICLLSYRRSTNAYCNYVYGFFYHYK